MACTFGTHLLLSYARSVAAARLHSSTPRNHALADVALMALLTHEQECRPCQQQAPALTPQPTPTLQPA